MQGLDRQQMLEQMTQRHRNSWGFEPSQSLGIDFVGSLSQKIEV